MTDAAEKITRERILESIKLLKDWATWLVTIQTAAIAATTAMTIASATSSNADLDPSVRR